MEYPYYPVENACYPLEYPDYPVEYRDKGKEGVGGRQRGAI